MKSSHIAALSALCVLSGSGWLLVEHYPSQLPAPVAACLHFTLIGCIGLALALPGTRHHTSVPWQSKDPLRTIGISGVCIFALPLVVLGISATSISPATSLSIFCAVPLFTVLAQSYGGTETRELLIPSLIGLSGALLLFPIELSHSLRGALAVLLIGGCCVALALASVRMHAVLQTIEMAAATMVACFASALVLAVYAATGSVPLQISLSSVANELLRCLVLDLPVVWITVWLLRELPPARLSARFLLAPLVTVLEGFASLRISPPLRSLIALFLLVSGGLLLIFKDEPAEPPGLSLQ